MAFDLTNKEVQHLIPAVLREIEAESEQLEVTRAGVSQDRNGRHNFSIRVQGPAEFIHVLLNYDARKQAVQWAVTGRNGVLASRNTGLEETPQAIAVMCRVHAAFPDIPA